MTEVMASGNKLEKIQIPHISTTRTISVFTSTFKICVDGGIAEKKVSLSEHAVAPVQTGIEYRNLSRWES